MTSSSKRAWWSVYLAPLLLFFILPILAFPEIIFGGQTLYWSDLSWIHYPRHLFAAQEWLAGRVPLWDPYQHNGLPFLAKTQVGAIYPLSALFLSSFSPSIELSLYILVHFSLAALFTFILARSLELDIAAATVAGLSFGFGGFLMAQVPNLNIMTGAVWLPLILYAIIRTCRQRSWLVAVLGGVPLALQILTSQPQIVFYTLVTITAYGVYRVLADLVGQKPSRTGLWPALHTILLLVVAVLSGLLLAAPQLLPTYELQQLSVRSQDRGFAFLTENSLPPFMWLNLLIPSAYGNNVTGFKGGDPFQEDFIYIGLIALVLALFSPGLRHKRDMPFFALLLIGGALLAMGRHTPLYQVVVQFFPGFGLFRIPARWLVVVNLALAVLAGFGLESINRKGLSRRQLGGVLLVCAALTAVIALVWVFRSDLPGLAGRWPDSSREWFQTLLTKSFTVSSAYADRLVLGQVVGLTMPVFLLVANIVVTAIVFVLFAARRVSTNTFDRLIIIALSVDLVVTGGTTINPTQPDSWWQQLSGGARYVLDRGGQGRVFPLGMGSERLAVSHLGHYFPSVYRVRSAGGHGSSLMLQRTRDFLDRSHPVQAIRVLGVRFILTEGQMGADAAATYPIAYSDDTSVVYENLTPTPRVYIVHNVIRAATPEEALQFFETANLDPLNTVVLESEMDIPRAIRTSAGSTATVVEETTQKIVINVNAAKNGYLVLSDTYYPGWLATLDDNSTPIYRANYVGRAVFVPAGRHTVVYKYSPLSFSIGTGLFLLTLLALFGLIIRYLWRKNALK